MTINVPLAITIGTGRYTNVVRDFSFRVESPGGCRYITIDLPTSATAHDDSIRLMEPVYISDARSGQVVAEGVVADIGRGSQDGEGAIISITAWGPKTHASESSVPIIYCDTRTSTWEQNTPLTTEVFTVGGREAADDDGESQGFRFSPEIGETVTTADEGFVEYRQLYYTGQGIGRISGTYQWGVTDANYLLVGDSRADPLSAWGANWVTLASTTGGPFNFTDVVTTDISSTHKIARLGMVRNSSSTTGARTHWLDLWNLKVMGQRYTKAGTVDVTGANYISSLWDNHVVEDLLGRLLNKYDHANALVVSTTNDLGHLAYYDSTTAAQVLDDLMAINPGKYWMTYPAQYYNGKASFEYALYKTRIRYEVTLEDPGDYQESVTELYNRVTVRWKDKQGRPRNTVRTTTNEVLDAAGSIRQAFVDAGSTVNTVATAETMGDTFLAAHSKPSNHGTLDVRRPIKDVFTGRWVDPWEIVPGELVRVRGAIPYPQSLAQVDADGQAVSRIAACEYQADANAARLELNAESPSIARALNVLAQKEVRRA